MFEDDGGHALIYLGVLGLEQFRNALILKGNDGRYIRNGGLPLILCHKQIHTDTHGGNPLILLNLNNEIVKAIGIRLHQHLHILLRIKRLHLLTNINQVVLNVLEHGHLTHDEFAHAVGLESDLVADLGLELVEVLGDVSTYRRKYLLYSRTKSL